MCWVFSCYVIAYSFILGYCMHPFIFFLSNVGCTFSGVFLSLDAESLPLVCFSFESFNSNSIVEWIGFEVLQCSSDCHIHDRVQLSYSQPTTRIASGAHHPGPSQHLRMPTISILPASTISWPKPNLVQHAFTLEVTFVPSRPSIDVKFGILPNFDVLDAMARSIYALEHHKN